MILNRVVCTTFQISSDNCPLIVKLTVTYVQNELLLLAPLILLNLGVQMIMPTLSALLANATR